MAKKGKAVKATVLKKPEVIESESFTLGDLARTMCEKWSDFSLNGTNDYLKDVFGLISDAIVSGKSVSIHGFGTFKLIERQARVGRNPRTGESIEIPERKALKFKPASKLRESIKGL